MESKEASAQSKASLLVSAFEDRFLAIHATYHPPDLPGEIAGKSSNVSWAAREMFNVHRLDKNRENIIITVMDCK
jgi:hypothetical protein